MKRRLSIAVFIMAVILLSGIAMAQNVIDEQFGPSGSKVELVKAKVRNGVLTLAVRYIHPWELTTEEERDKLRKFDSGNRMNQIRKREIPIKFKVGSVFYIANSKRYYVLKDEEGNWLASPVVGDYIAEPMDNEAVAKHLKKGKVPALLLDNNHPVKILWFKFPVPPEGVNEIEFQIPEVSPFDVELKK